MSPLLTVSLPTCTTPSRLAYRYVVDTPGVMLPLVESEDVGLKLALVGALRDEQVGHELIADYLLYTLNRRGRFKYVYCQPAFLDPPHTHTHAHTHTHTHTCTHRHTHTRARARAHTHTHIATTTTTTTAHLHAHTTAATTTTINTLACLLVALLFSRCLPSTHVPTFSPIHTHDTTLVL
jgi:hypothetical protein